MSKNFQRFSSYKLSRLSSSWRKPRGLHNKLRLGLKDYGKRVSIGYGTGSTTKIIKVICTEKELREVATEENKTVIFSTKLGKRKKLILFKLAQDLKVTILNVDKDFTSKVEDELKKRKEVREERKLKKEKKQKELDKKVQEKKSEKDKGQEKELTDEERKEQEKKEKDKILTKKEGM